MKIFTYISLAFIALRAAKVRAFLTMLGIIIGTTSVILLISLGTGLEKYITKQIEDIGSNLLYVLPGRVGGGRGPGGATVNRLNLEQAEYIRTRVKDAQYVSAAVTKSTRLKYNNKEVKNTTIYGIDEYFNKVINIKTDKGRDIRPQEINNNSKVVVLGSSAASKLSNNIIGKQITISNRKYTVVGIAKERGSVFGVDQDNAAYIPINLMLNQFGTNNVNAIYVKAKSPEDVNKLQQKVQAAMSRKISEDDFTVTTQKETLNTIQGILGVLSLALGGIAAISLVVGGIGIMNIMLVSVTERTKEIGLRKAVGAPPSAILWQFLIEAVVLSIMGGIIGIALGYLGSAIMSNFIATEVPMWAVLLAFGFSAFVGIVFGVAPAIRASRLDPIVALRYE
ncbi:MAG: ABC transporter permease [bacterium]|nr:ABC transporter permease [bacterium]